MYSKSKKLKKNKEWACKSCGSILNLDLNGDLNAAINIKNEGNKLGMSLPKKTPLESKSK